VTETTKAGFAAILGKPNAGKSTLVNRILGTKLSIVTPKPQTTRKRVSGIFSSDSTQIVFIDNPGILEPKYELQRSMMNYIEESLQEADILIYLIDVRHSESTDFSKTGKFFTLFKNSDKPKLLILNKIDLLKDVKSVLPIIKQYDDLKLFDEIIPISALKGESFSEVIKTLEKYLPESPFYYDPEQISTLNERFFAEELIREVVFLSYHDELPFSADIHINEFKERENGKWYIAADIIVERKSQKGIIIGAGGQKLKTLGENARHAIEKHLQQKVYLQLFVKVNEKWRNDRVALKRLGY
jgi:GTPase